jgi:hypothetical protein
MAQEQLSDLALRLAVNCTTRELSQEGGQVENIKALALKRLEELHHANGQDTNKKESLSAQASLILVAVKTLEFSYQAITKQLEVLQHQRLAFDKERQAGIATFTLPLHKEEKDLSSEEKVFKAFVDIIFKDPKFAIYFGIHYSEITPKQEEQFYSVLPFYRLSETIAQPLQINSSLNRQALELELFFKSALPDSLADIDTHFQTESRFIAFWESAFRRSNYLKDRRLARFFMMAWSNLLWNLHRPIDPNTGLLLNISSCIELCRNVEVFINQLLSSEHSPYLQLIKSDHFGIYSFLRKVEIHTKALHAAYAEEQLHELNLEDLAQSARHTLLYISKSTLKLIYKRHHPLTNSNEADEKAAEQMAYMVGYLNQLLIRNTELIHVFHTVPSWIPVESMLNKPPVTIVDVLILLCHLSWRERDHLLEQLKQSKMETAIEFAHILKEFDKKFIKPIKQVSKQELHSSPFHPKHQEVSQLTAQRLVPFISLVIQAYRIQVDNPISHEFAEFHRHHLSLRKIINGIEQIQTINATAFKNDSYYAWSLTPFVPLSIDIASNLNGLPQRQYRLILITELLDNLRELIQNYHSFIQNKLFQAFLLKFLHHVKEEYALLETQISRLDSELAQQNSMSRQLKSIIAPMTQEISKHITTFRTAAANVELVVGAPDFTDQQRQLLSAKLSIIAHQYSNLFSEPSGMEAFLDPCIQLTLPKQALSASEPGSEACNPQLQQKIHALKLLVERCYYDLSYQSRKGHKGLLLHELLTMVEFKPTFTEAHIKHIIMELTRITASYRENWLFHAPYGQTRSAKTLIAAVKDPELNQILPLASILFNQGISAPNTLTDEQVLQQLLSLREGSFWAKSSDEIRLSSL